MTYDRRLRQRMVGNKEYFIIEGTKAMKYQVEVMWNYKNWFLPFKEYETLAKALTNAKMVSGWWNISDVRVLDQDGEVVWDNA